MATESRADGTINTVDDETKQAIKVAALEAKRMLESGKLCGLPVELTILLMWFMAPFLVFFYCSEIHYVLLSGPIVGWGAKLFAVLLFPLGLLVLDFVRVVMSTTNENRIRTFFWNRTEPKYAYGLNRNRCEIFRLFRFGPTRTGIATWDAETGKSRTKIHNHNC